MSPVRLTPSDRLALSRERLRQAVRDSSAPFDDAAKRRAGGASLAWPDGLESIPGASILMEAVSSWWAQHPLRIASMVAADAVKAVVQPMAQRHPLALVLGAFVLGGLFTWSRPWRLILTPALFAGLLPQILSKAMALVPPRSWLLVLTSLAQQQSRSRKAAAQAGSPHSPAHTSAH